MEKMMIVIGILVIPPVIVYLLFCIYWYGTMLVDWIFENIFGVTDWIGMAMFGGYNDNSQYSDDFSSNTDRLGWKNNYYYKDAHQDCPQVAPDKDDYQILGVRQNADLEEIKKAWRKLCKKYHPDYNPGNKTAEERIKQINGAYERLTKRQNMEVR